MGYWLGVSSMDDATTSEAITSQALNVLDDQIAVGGLTPSVGVVKRGPGRPRKVPLLANGQHLRAEHVAEELRTKIKTAIKRYLEIGHLLIEKKDALGHGEFLRLFEDHPNAIARPLKMKKRRAQQHMELARDTRIARHFSRLPSSFDTLVVLTHLPSDAFDAWVADGSIHENLSRASAQKLVKAATTAASAQHQPCTGTRMNKSASVKLPPGTAKARLAWWTLVDECTSDELPNAMAELIRLMKLASQE